MADADLRSLAERLQGLCLGRGLTVAVAESCTGGLVAATLTDVPGSSGYFRGGIVPYADAAKTSLLGVPEGMLAAHGAVSAQVARSMAIGARDRLGASFGASITGIAGPDGGSAEKPVGLTYIGLARAGAVDVHRYIWIGDRTAVRHASVREALGLLIRWAEEPAEEDRP